MKSGMGGQKSECHPALVDIRCGGILKAADVMRPEAEAAHHEGKTAAQALLHGLVIRPAVAAPVNGELLSADRRGTREENRLSLSSLAL